MATSIVNLSKISEIADHEASSRYKNIENAVHMTGVFTKFTYNKFSLVAMATSLEDVRNKFVIANHANTTITAKHENMVHMVGVMANFVHFGYEI